MPVQKDSGFQGQIETKPVLLKRPGGPPCSPRIPLCPPRPGPRGQRQHLRVGLGRRRQLRGLQLQLRRLRIEHVDHLHQLWPSTINEAGPHSTMRAAPPRWPPPSAMCASGTPRPGRRGECGPGVREDISDVTRRYSDVMDGRPSFRESALFRGEMPPSSRLVMLCYQSRGLTKNKNAMTSFPLMVYRFSCSLFWLTNNDEL